MSFICFQSDHTEIKGRNLSHVTPCVNIFITSHGLAFVISINKLMLAVFDTTGVNTFSPFLLNSIKIIVRIVHRKVSLAVFLLKGLSCSAVQTKNNHLINLQSF